MELAWEPWWKVVSLNYSFERQQMLQNGPHEYRTHSKERRDFLPTYALLQANNVRLSLSSRERWNCKLAMWNVSRLVLVLAKRLVVPLPILYMYKPFVCCLMSTCIVGSNGLYNCNSSAIKKASNPSLFSYVKYSPLRKRERGRNLLFMAYFSLHCKAIPGKFSVKDPFLYFLRLLLPK